MAGNSQEFITIIKLNSEEAKNNLEQLKKESMILQRLVTRLLLRKLIRAF